MKIKLYEISVADLVAKYQDDGEGGVVGYGGRLNIRPPYQREFIYKDPQRNAVIDTVSKDYPLNVMYWAVREDGGFEIIDGQQRTVSICRYVANKFSVAALFDKPQSLKFINLQPDEQKKIMIHKLMVYQCEGSDSEKLKWFKTINIAGEKLEQQELRNAVYYGSWVTAAKKYFSSETNCPAQKIGGDYLTGLAIRQAYLETVIKWISHGQIEKYMSDHQHDENAESMWDYFQKVIAWVETTFKKKRKDIMQGVEWGRLYNDHHHKTHDAATYEKRIADLIADTDEKRRQKGIYEFILTGEEKHLTPRAFDDRIKRKIYEQQHGNCKKCGERFALHEMHGDHIKPWSKGGKTVEENCQMLCQKCNTEKSNKW